MMSGSSQLEDTVSHEEFAEAAHRYLDAILACEHCWYQIGYTEATHAALLESDETSGTGAPPREEVRYAVMEKDVVNVPPPPPDGPPPPDVPPPPPGVPPDVKVMAVSNVVPPVHKPRPHAMAVPNVPPVPKPKPHAMAVAKAPPAHSMAIATAIAALHVVGASADFYDQKAKKRCKLTSPTRCPGAVKEEQHDDKPSGGAVGSCHAVVAKVKAPLTLPIGATGGAVVSCDAAKVTSRAPLPLPIGARLCSKENPNFPKHRPKQPAMPPPTSLLRADIAAIVAAQAADAAAAPSRSSAQAARNRPSKEDTDE